MTPHQSTSPRAIGGQGHILGPDLISRQAYRAALVRAVDLVADMPRPLPYSGASTEDLRRLLVGLDPLPEKGTGVDTALTEVGLASLRHALWVGHGQSMAHLHCPVAVSALAAEVLISAANQSLDSWDQSPFATQVEDKVIRWLCDCIGLPAVAGGCFTSGGSQSNMTALYLAAKQFGVSARQTGVIFASDHAHFSIGKSADILGFAPWAVMSVATDEQGCLRPDALRQAIHASREAGRQPLAIVATAGTTDLGAIDPLPAIAAIAEAESVWLHVDAAYGGGLIFSRHADRLAGLEKANSITLDFHKMLFQPISCSTLLVRDHCAFAPLADRADYLNPEQSVFADAPNLVERSFQTTRRGDALKVLMTCRTLGRRALADLIDQTLENAQAAARAIESRGDLTLARQPSLSTVLFRYQSPFGPERSDAITIATRAELFHRGIASIATTVLDGRVHFKLTLLHPASTVEVIAPVLDATLSIIHSLENSHVSA